jgi:hypothetical protein
LGCQSPDKKGAGWRRNAVGCANRGILGYNWWVRVIHENILEGMEIRASNTQLFFASRHAQRGNRTYMYLYPLRLSSGVDLRLHEETQAV